jgi:hypothetical protein
MNVTHPRYDLEENVELEGHIGPQDPTGRYLSLRRGAELTILDTLADRLEIKGRIEVDPGARLTALSPDGAAVVGTSGDRLLRFPAVGSSPRIHPDGPSLGLGSWFSADGRHLMLTDAVKGNVIARLFDGNTLEPVDELPIQAYDHNTASVESVYAHARVSLRQHESAPDLVLGCSQSSSGLAVSFGFEVTQSRLALLDPMALGKSLDPWRDLSIGAIRLASSAIVASSFEGHLVRVPWPGGDDHGEKLSLQEPVRTMLRTRSEGDVDTSRLYFGEVLCSGERLLVKVGGDEDDLCLAVGSLDPLALQDVIPTPSVDGEPSFYHPLQASLVVRGEQGSSEPKWQFYRVRRHPS